MMEGAGYSVTIFVALVVAVTALAGAFMVSRRGASKMLRPRGNDATAAALSELAAELRRSNDLLEARVADHEDRLRRLERDHDQDLPGDGVPQDAPNRDEN
ncbi:Flp pilus assembly protein TadB [Rhodobium orientis]|uniref:Uncharacterized protein n=1 Tax=Rhodobium orientis TaxID=34017 RepID=A0A327JF46_9HYPH|nr:hypothetical protein [Rhodobium orientis]MBB4301575.1 Flp pilus assembly protein TadB [Rhodobium orientis]MBK5952270.1 hypothetical protein [Rhodobium orientis]RAI24959.1 hypothetical protein CH339_20495 [Rhodobium orientis]